VGSAGSGKTLLGVEFLFEGAMRYNEPGVFVAFEETAEDLQRASSRIERLANMDPSRGFERFCRAVLRAPDNRIAIWNESHG
jgi:KaiC/GvpD/RAD55 family RecA-like ATPase